MSAQLIDGKQIAMQIREEIAAEASQLAGRGVQPGLAVILVGDDPASQIYVRNKGIACEKAGFRSETIRLPAQTTQAELEAVIERLNTDSGIHGILVQLPLPAHLDEAHALLAIRPEKDVDGFHPVNAGRLLAGQPCAVPCTPQGVMELLRRSQVPLSGKRAVVLGRSNIVGKPMALLLLAANCTVTICHSRTENLPAIAAEADILVSAIGKAGFVTADMVKPGAAVIDVGINRVPTPDGKGRVVGDVDFDAVREKAGWITPVPGGVGPMTIAMLLRNTLEAARRV